MLIAGTERRPPGPQKENTMNASQPAARSHTASALVTAVAAAWFVLATGTAFAAPTQPAEAAAASPVTLTPQGTMKLTVVAARPATQVALTPAGTMKLTVVAARPTTQVALTPEGAMKLTVVGQRTQPAPVQTAAAREARRS